MADYKVFDGHFLIYRKKAKGVRRNVGGGKMPYFRHTTIESAEKEARRLSTEFPDSTFVIMREVARIKGTPSKAEADGI